MAKRKLHNRHTKIRTIVILDVITRRYPNQEIAMNKYNPFHTLFSKRTNVPMLSFLIANLLRRGYHGNIPILFYKQEIFSLKKFENDLVNVINTTHLLNQATLSKVVIFLSK